MISLSVRKTFADGIVRSTSYVFLITLGVKFLGYMEKLLLAYYFGVGHEVDAYTVVVSFVLSFFFLFRELIEPGYLRVFIGLGEAKEDRSSWDLFNYIFMLIIIITTSLTTMVLIFPAQAVQFLAPGFEGEVKKLSVNLLYLAVPAIILMCLSTLTNITLNAQKKFVLPNLGDLALKGSVVLLLLLLYEQLGIYAAIGGLLIGSILKLVIHLTGLWTKVSLKKVTVDRLHLRKLWRLTWPLMIGVVFSQASTLFDNVFASFLREGAIAALSYAKKVVELPVIIFPYALSVVIFPYFSQLSIEQDKEKLKDLLSKAIKWILIMFLPLSIFYYLFQFEIVRVIFQRGAFDFSSTQLTALPTGIYSMAMAFMAIETVLVIFYFANGNTKMPVLWGIIGVIINIILTYILSRTIGYTGIAYAFVISRVLKVSVLLIKLDTLVAFQYASVFQFILKVTFPTLLFGLVLLVLKNLFMDQFTHSTFQLISFLAGCGLLATVLYIVSLYLMKIERVSS